MIVSNQQIDQIVGSLDAVLTADLEAEELKKALSPVMSLCLMSTKVTCKVFYPNRFRLPFAPTIHDPMFEVLDNDLWQKVMILAPRGVGKTSVTQLGFSSRNILFQLRKFIIPVSCSERQALNQTESLKMELMSNLMIKKLFGSNLKGDWFSKEQWTTSTDICIMPRGMGQQIRGLLYRDFRPDLHIWDDIEDPESVSSEDYRKKVKKWVYEDAMLSVDDKEGSTVFSPSKIVLIDTLKHEDSLTANILENYETCLKAGRIPEWRVVHLSICDEHLKSNWPEAYSDEWILTKIEEYREKKMMDSFAREFMNLPVSGESNFSKNYFQYYEEDPKRPLETAVLVDLAKTIKPESSETAIVAVGVDTDKQAIYVREVIHGHMYPDEIINLCFELALRWKARVIGYEVTGLNEFITFPMKNEKSRKGYSFELVALHARAKKEDRIAALLPFYRQGMVFHRRNACLDLEIQLLSYPRAKRWDIMDVLAYIIPLMESGNRYFLPASWDSLGDPEEEYKELEKDNLEPLDVDWMVA